VVESLLNNLEGSKIGPEHLRRFDRVIFALGTAEPKQALVVHGFAPEPISVSSLRKRTRDCIGYSTWYPKSNSIYMSYLINSLLPTGLAQKTNKGYQLTLEAENYAKPIAALLLEYSASQDIPASKIFGQPITSTELISPEALYF